MDNLHPIPQNVTSFQFKLIGDMTLKQFAYLAAGSVVAYLLFVFLAHDYPVITWPLIVISVLLGAAFAFLPIESRPLDHWLKAFLKAVYSPTKRTWGKNNKTFKENSLFESRLVMYLSGVPLGPAGPYIGGPETPVKPVEPLPTEEELKQTVDLAREAQQLQMKIIQTERTLSQIKNQAQQPVPVPIDYSRQVNKAMADLQNLVNQSSAVKQQIKAVQEPAVELPAPVPAPIIQREKIKVIPKGQQPAIALTTFPNVINGIVKDKQNDYLDAVVAVIYDKEGLPVRALKTNKLGQFTGSTPLPNGTYTLELEKDNFTFDVLQMDLTGGVLPPLMITAK